MMICGRVEAAEDTTIGLSGVPMELRNIRGMLIASQKTGTGGTYAFTSSALAVGADYFVHPVVNRNQSSNPLYVAVKSLLPTGASADFQIRGVPVVITITGLPGAFTLLSPGSAYVPSATEPPQIAPGGGNYYSSVIDMDGKTLMLVPGGFPYFLSCWTPTRTTNGMRYQRTNSTIPGILKPLDQVQTSCP